MLAFVLLLVGVLVLSLQDVLVKQTAADTSFWQLQTVDRPDHDCPAGGGQWRGASGWPPLCRPCPRRAGNVHDLLFRRVAENPVAQMATGLYTYPFLSAFWPGRFLASASGFGVLARFALARQAVCLCSTVCRNVHRLSAGAGNGRIFLRLDILILRPCRQESPLALVYRIADVPVFRHCGRCHNVIPAD